MPWPGSATEATAIGLLRPGQDTGEVYRFGHALIRETLYAELTPQARAQAHRSVAAVLEKRPGGASAELAYHFLRAAARRRRRPPPGRLSTPGWPARTR